MTEALAGQGITEPTANVDDLERAARQRQRLMYGYGLLTALLLGTIYALSGGGMPLLPLAALIALLTPTLIWRYPRLALYVPFAAACLFEMFPLGYSDSLTDQVPVFWNVNTIFQRFAHLDVKAIPFSLLEVFLLLASVPSLIRAVYLRRFSVHTGELARPILIYIGFVLIGWINGMATGGDFKDSLQEVRSQVYFAIAYVTAANLIASKREERTLLWIAAICIALKGALLTFRQFVTLGGAPIPDQGIGSHEEVFFFNAYVALLLSLTLTRSNPRMRLFLWLLLPAVLLGNLACNRRAGTAAFAVYLPILFLAAFRALPDRRRIVALVGIVTKIKMK